MNKEALKRRGFNLRLLAIRKGLTGRRIARRLRCHPTLVSLAFAGERFEALRRVEKFVKSYRPKAAA